MRFFLTWCSFLASVFTVACVHISAFTALTGYTEAVPGTWLMLGMFWLAATAILLMARTEAAL